MKIQTGVLKVVLLLLTIGVAALAVLVVPVVARVSGTQVGMLSWLLGAGLYLAIGFVVSAIYGSYQLLQAIDAATAFSQQAVHILGRIKLSAYGVAATLALVSPVVYVWVQAEDAPGLLLFNFVLLAAALVIGIFANVLQKLLASAVAIKQENELTI